MAMVTQFEGTVQPGKMPKLTSRTSASPPGQNEMVPADDFEVRPRRSLMSTAPLTFRYQDDTDSSLGSDTEFADRHPNTEVIGTDLSPCQPQWMPPNLRFEIDDAVVQPWAWKEDYFDFIHMRYLFGAIKDWNALFKEAYRCCAPGGWVQSAEADVRFRSDDGSTELEPIFKTYQKLFEEGSRIIGNPFFVHELQQKAFKETGFTDIKTVDYKFPFGGWPKDPKLAGIGQFVKTTLENDLEGYTLMMWQDVCKWPEDEYQVALMSLHKAIRNPKVHSYMTVRYVYGRK
ncbi:S-adenosyl-L-methionine-dependent methyltransferase [Fusarium acuminatum]|uniref:S-adenosyl-L-methionine-dependent methyltransferase n=1 Tax=Fusarium acuminatum TaxID=5515 RepID=A0ABZ2X8D5_9HYPO